MSPHLLVMMGGTNLAFTTKKAALAYAKSMFDWDAALNKTIGRDTGPWVEADLYTNKGQYIGNGIMGRIVELGPEGYAEMMRHGLDGDARARDYPYSPTGD